ncbi:MAG: DmsE family decaheme c-type cytochrome [Bryobacteraceae bacterium]|nr:DmsE family decaheme c-type cytochrome [Bryobacteraceae bacterium]MDW8377280.1 DmsE family decaheme c-type cytochrome [Bryobacterales bacterium]
MNLLPWRTALLSVLCLAALTVATAKDKPKKTKAEYMGSVTCQGCHEEISRAFEKNPHFIVESHSKHGWKERACESCHGPGSIHAESASPTDIDNPAKMPPRKGDQACLSCHRNQVTQVGNIFGGHARSEVACTQCHSIHDSARKKPAEDCGSCHVATLAEFQKPYRHRFQEGGIRCVDCHNPHGREIPTALRVVSANEPGCFRCHGDKRGPFTFEHAPMRMEGCRACHEPHGSANPRMLTRQEVRLQCLECHSNLSVAAGTLGGPPPAFHDLRSSRIQNCTICHVKIHGSHVNRSLLR